MKKIKSGSIILQIGFVIYIIENFYFGWNKTPMSDLELYADITVKVLIYTGFILYFIPIWQLYEEAVKKHEENKTK